MSSQLLDRRSQQTVGLVLALVAAMAVLGWLWSGLTPSSAAFADREVIDGNHLGAGKLDIAIGGETAAFVARNLAPGDLADGRLVLENSGTLPLRYELFATATASPLADVLDVTAWNDSGACSPSATGDVAVWRPLESRPDGPAGAPTTGRLAPGEQQLVCMSARLPISASSDLQGRSLAMVIGIAAEHDVAATTDAGSQGTP